MENIESKVSYLKLIKAIAFIVLYSDLTVYVAGSININMIKINLSVED